MTNYAPTLTALIDGSDPRTARTVAQVLREIAAHPDGWLRNTSTAIVYATSLNTLADQLHPEGARP